MHNIQSPQTVDQAIEAQIKAVGADKAPRITPADIEANIAGEYWFTADKALEGCPLLPGLELLTICVLVLKNGFTIIGKSACASPENFNAEIGRKVARDDAVNQMWPLMGYALKERLATMTQIPVLGEVS